MKDSRIGGAVVLAMTLTLGACATDRSPAEAPAASQAAAQQAAPPSGTIAEELVTATATVEKVDLKTRLVTLRRADGKTVTVKAGERVKNLAQVKKGDEVTVGYYESLAYQVKRPGEATPGAALAEVSAAAKPGQRPAGAEAQQLTVTTTIEAIDTKANTVTLKNAAGDVFTTKVRNPDNLKRVKVGDLVELTYTEAIAVSVEPAAAKPKAK